jgi:hypothetical protein
MTVAPKANHRKGKSTMNKAYRTSLNISLITIVSLGTIANAQGNQASQALNGTSGNTTGGSADAVPTYQTVIDGASPKAFLGNDIPVDLRWDPKKDEKRAKKLAQKQAKEQAKNQDGTQPSQTKKSGSLFGAVKAVGAGCAKVVVKTADFVGFPVGDDDD